MKYIAAYMLLTLGGNTEPKADDITKLLKAGGIECDEARINALLKELEGKDINQLIAEGSTKLASVPSGGAAAAAPAAGAAAGGAAAPAAAAKVEEKEESDEDMGFGLFD